jgi:hypothetical protein
MQRLARAEGRAMGDIPPVSRRGILRSTRAIGATARADRRLFQRESAFVGGSRTRRGLRRGG